MAIGDRIRKLFRPKPKTPSAPPAQNFTPAPPQQNFTPAPPPKQPFTPVNGGGGRNFTPANFTPASPADLARASTQQQVPTSGVGSSSGGNIVTKTVTDTAQGLARVSTIGSVARLAQGIKEGEGFNASRIAQGNAGIEALSNESPEQQAQSAKALTALSITSTVAGATGIIRSALSGGALRGGAQAGVEYATAREAVQAGDYIGFAKNLKNVAFSKQMIEGVFLNSKGAVSPTKLAGVAVTSAATVGTMIGTYPWASWSGTEASEIMSLSIKDAAKSGDPQLLQEAFALQNEILNRDKWEQLAEKIPFVNIAERFRDKYQALAFQAKAQQAAAKAVIDNVQSVATASGQPADVSAAIINTKEQTEKIATAEAKSRTDYYNQERIRVEKLLREAEVQARNEDAAFWRAEKEKTFKREAEERQKAAEFWLAYRQQLQAMQEDSGPSSLSFGLL